MEPAEDWLDAEIRRIQTAPPPRRQVAQTPRRRAQSGDWLDREISRIERSSARSTTSGTSATTTRRTAPQAPRAPGGDVTFEDVRLGLAGAPALRPETLMREPMAGAVAPGEAPPESLGGELWNAARRGVLNARASVNEIGAQLLPGAIGERDARIADEFTARAGAIPRGQTVQRMQDFLQSDLPAGGIGADELADGERSSVPAGFEGILPERYTRARPADMRDGVTTDPLAFARYGAVKAVESLPGTVPSLAVGMASGGASLPVQLGAQMLVNAPQEIGGALQDAAHDETGARRAVSGRAKLAAVVSGTASSVLESVADRALAGAFADAIRAAPAPLRQRLREAVAETIVESPAKEGSTEYVQQVIQNAGAKIGWDPSRELTEGAAEAAMVGAIMGGGIGAAGPVAGAAGRVAAPAARAAFGAVRGADVGAQTPAADAARRVVEMDDAALDAVVEELGDIPYRLLDDGERAIFRAATTEQSRRIEGPITEDETAQGYGDVLLPVPGAGRVDASPIDYEIGSRVVDKNTDENGGENVPAADAQPSAPTATETLAALDALPVPSALSDVAAREQARAALAEASALEQASAAPMPFEAPPFDEPDFDAPPFDGLDFDASNFDASNFDASNFAPPPFDAPGYVPPPGFDPDAFDPAAFDGAPFDPSTPFELPDFAPPPQQAPTVRTAREIEDALEAGETVDPDELAAHPAVEARWRPYTVSAGYDARLDAGETLTLDDYRADVAARSTDAGEIAAAWQAARGEDAQSGEAEGSLGAALSDWRRAGGRVDSDSFAAYADRPDRGSSIPMRWLQRGGEPVDGVALALGEALGREVSPQEVVDAITAPAGSSPAREAADALADRYRDVTGRSLTGREAARAAGAPAPAASPAAQDTDVPDAAPAYDDAFQRRPTPRRSVPGAEARAQMDRSDAEAIVKAVRLGRVEIVDSERGLPGKARAKIIMTGAEGQVSGLFDASSGRVFLVLRAMPRTADGRIDAYEVARTIAHEAAGHAGLRAVLGARLDKVLDRVARDFADHPQMAEIARTYELDTATEKGRREAAEEFVAHRAEDDAFQKSGPYKRIRYLVREALREMAGRISGGRWTGPEMNDADVAALIARAARAARQGAEAASGDGVRFLYAGPKARNFGRMDALGRTFAGRYDGLGRFEIDDSGARLLLPEGEDSRWAELADVLAHPRLFAEYPALRNLLVRVQVDPTVKNERGAFTTPVAATRDYFGRAAEVSVTAPTRERVLSVLLHEVQHAIQETDGLAKGGNPDGFEPITTEGRLRQIREEVRSIRDQAPSLFDAWEAYSQYNHALQQKYGNDFAGQATENEIEGWDHLFAQWEAAQAAEPDPAKRWNDLEMERYRLQKGVVSAEESPMQQYKRVAGEIEARDVQARQSMSAGERARTAPYSSENIPAERAIVRFQRRPGSEGADLSRRVDASRDGTLYTGDPRGARRQAALANPGATPEARAVVEAADSQRFEQGDPRSRTRAEMQTGADAALALDRRGVEQRLRDGELLDTPEKVLAAMRVVSDAGAAAIASGDPGALADAAMLVHRYREARAETARALGAGTDPSETPEMRRRRLLVESVVGIDERASADLRDAKERYAPETTRTRRMADDAEAEHARLDKEHEADAARLDAARTEVQEAEAALSQTRADLAATLAALQQRRRAIDATTREATRDAAAAERETAALVGKRSEAREQIAFQAKRAETLRAEVATLEREIGTRAAELKAARERAANLRADFKRAERRLKVQEDRAAQQSARRAEKARRALAAVGVDLADVAAYQGDSGAPASPDDVEVTAATRAPRAARAPSPEASAARAEADAARQTFEAKRAALLERMREKGFDTDGVRFSRGDGQAGPAPLPEGGGVAVDFGGDAELEAMYVEMMNASADARAAEAKAARLEAKQNAPTSGDGQAGPAPRAPRVAPAVLSDPTLAMEAITVAMRARGGQGWAKGLEYYRASLLSGLATHVVNNVSNVLNLLVSYGLERPAGAIAGSLTFGKTRYEGATLGELPRLYGALLSGRTWYNAVRRGVMSYRMEIPVTAAELGFEQASQGHEVQTGAIPGKLGRAVRVPLRALGMADEVAKSIITSMEIGAQAYRIAKQEGRTGDALDRRIRELVETGGSDAALLALDAAARRTFQNLDDALVREMEARGLGRSENAGGKISSGITMLRREIPPLTFVLPFITTPANILARTARLTPLGIVPLAVKYRTLPPGAARDRVAEMLVGSAITMALFGFAGGEDEDGRPYLTGSAPAMRERGKREMGQRAFPPASILIGGRYYSYARLQPLSSLLTLAADSHAAMKADEAGKENPWARVFDAAITQVRDQSFLAGIGDIIKAFEEPGKGIPNFAARFAVGWVPNMARSGLRARLPEQLDNRAESLGGILPATLQQAAPGIVQAQAKVDLWGRPMLADGGPVGGAAGDYLWRLMTPVRSQQATGIHQADLLIRRYNLRTSGEEGQEEYYPQLPMRSGWLKDLPNEQYWTFVRTRGEIARAQVEADLASGALSAEAPTRADIDRIEDIFTEARELAKERMLGKPERRAPSDPGVRAEKTKLRRQMREREGRQPVR